MTAQTGTYIREPDGAWHMYHSPYFYKDAASAFRNDRTDWRKVTEQAERDKVRNEVSGELLPGEYVEIGR